MRLGALAALVGWCCRADTHQPCPKLRALVVCVVRVHVGVFVCVVVDIRLCAG